MSRLFARPLATALGCLAAASALAILAAPPARAAFPGRPGKIVFSTRSRTANPAIQTIARRGARPHRLARGFDPAYSPDGRLIAYTVSDGTHSTLMVMRSDGSHRHAVLRRRVGGSEPAFSADGKRLFFVHDSSGEGYGDIWSVGLDGRHLRRLTATRGERGESSPAAAANGRYIVFELSNEIFTMRPDGSRKKRLTRGAFPAISPNSHRVAFVRGGQLYSIGAGGGHLRRLTHFGSIRTPRRPAFSPDGRRLVFVLHRHVNVGVAWNEAQRLATISARGGRPRRLTSVAIGGECPDWQPRR